MSAVGRWAADGGPLPSGEVDTAHGRHITRHRGEGHGHSRRGVKTPLLAETRKP